MCKKLSDNMYSHVKSKVYKIRFNHSMNDELKTVSLIGATITGNGVNDMFKEYLKLYDGFIQKTKK